MPNSIHRHSGRGFRKGRLAGLAAFAAFALSAVVPAVAQPAVQQLSVEDPGHAQIPVAIWTPAGDDGARPLVLLSHGTGAGPLAHVDTAVALAAAGFVVVAPMHPGDNFTDESAVGRPEWMVNRSRHVRRVLDFMLNDWPERGSIDPRTIGIFGFSAGATTALIAAGGAPDFGRTAAHCAESPEFVCRLLVADFGAPPAADAWAGDPRIAAAVVAAPGLGFAFEPSGLAGVRVPVQLWVGTEDETVPYATNGAVVRRLLPQPPDFHEVAGAAHLSFLAPCEPGATHVICRDREGFDRAAFHAEFNVAVVAFFRRHLRAR